MSDSEKIKWLKEHYNLNHKQRVVLNYDNTFKIKMGETYLDIPYPIDLTRQIKIEQLLK